MVAFADLPLGAFVIAACDGKYRRPGTVGGNHSQDGERQCAGLAVALVQLYHGFGVDIIGRRFTALCGVVWSVTRRFDGSSVFGVRI